MGRGPDGVGLLLVVAAAAFIAGVIVGVPEIIGWVICRFAGC